jgi:hypothetical protein
MAYENINLFFARDKNNNIITIDKINRRINTMITLVQYAEVV